MTNASTMLDLRPPRVAIDPTLHADTIDVVIEAARAARQCADACLWEPDPARRCISLNLDTAELCEAGAGVLIRMTDPAVAAVGLDAVRTALRACEQECRRHGAHLRHCIVCADVCARAEELCGRLAAALRPLAPEVRVAASQDATAATSPEVDAASPTPPPHDPLSPGADMGISGAAPEPNEPA